MEIKPGRYRADNGKVAVIERKIDNPLPHWRGYFEHESDVRTVWTDQGEEISGHKPWNLIERIEENTVRWNLQCIPTELDQFIRHRQIEEGKKYLCQQVVCDLQAYYRILESQILTGDIIERG